MSIYYDSAHESPDLTGAVHLNSAYSHFNHVRRRNNVIWNTKIENNNDPHDRIQTYLTNLNYACCSSIDGTKYLD